ncbi:hypothetical protein [Beggiatoa leptomitoformis]|uniref:DUF4139 domain-containing protein n=1 Tax=Beggiatoa leptomitoformis TaxID=288004 RepID=A0A2N9YEY0_9GAMM|nr:hypothetical protein [Beggiatoa leptomitoformis]ALG68662.1 hypothetical protein AL038_14320 [Beggiatoa leptomitoformis]AUI68986.1 hypothetical protein BLE401_09940 [Beggiatoa leptomitoformis]
MMKRMKKACIALLVVGLCGIQPAWARIKLVALPEREATLVRLDNPSATLLAEERVLTLQAGVNQVDFSWQGVEIQPDSIRLMVLEEPQAVKILSVSYPPNEPALMWEIASPVGQQVRVRINYLLNYIDRLVTYQAVVNKDETALDLTSFLVLRNFSGENLVTTRFLLDYGSAFESSVQTGETKRMQFFDAPALPIQKRFTFDASVLPWNPKDVGNNVGIPVHYEIHNTVEKGLGKHALWNGKTRVFSDDGHGSSIFLGEDNATFTPVGQILRLTTGQSRDVVVTQKKMKETISNEKRNDHNQRVLYDIDVDMQVEIENFKAQPALLTLREPMPTEWEMRQFSHPYQRKHNQEITFEVEIPAKGKTLVNYGYTQRNIQN